MYPDIPTAWNLRGSPRAGKLTTDDDARTVVGVGVQDVGGTGAKLESCGKCGGARVGSSWTGQGQHVRGHVDDTPVSC